MYSMCFVLNYFYKMIILSIINGNLGRESFYYDVFIYCINNSFIFAHRCFEKSITDYNKNMEEQLKINILF